MHNNIRVTKSYTLALAVLVAKNQDRVSVTRLRDVEMAKEDLIRAKP